jgi:hypothetical protein
MRISPELFGPLHVGQLTSKSFSQPFREGFFMCRQFYGRNADQLKAEALRLFFNPKRQGSVWPVCLSIHYDSFRSSRLRHRGKKQPAAHAEFV